MSSKINVSGLIRAHWKTLYHSDTGRVSYKDLFCFLVIPFVFCGIGVFFGFSLDSNSISLLVNFGSIFTALLLSVLVLVYDQKGRTEDVNKSNLLSELFNNICYSILLSILMVVFCLVGDLFEGKMLNIRGGCILSLGVYVVTPIIVFFLSHLILTILMILKRLHALLD